MRETGHIELATHVQVTTCSRFWMPLPWEEEEEAMMSAALKPQREIHENTEITYTAYAPIEHAFVGAQMDNGCSRDGTPHAHAVALTTHSPHCDASPSPSSRNEEALSTS